MGMYVQNLNIPSAYYVQGRQKELKIRMKTK